MKQAGRQFLLFAVAGVVGFGVDVAVLYLAAPLLGWYGARVLSFLAAATTTWVMNRHLAFGERHSETTVWREYASYLATMLGGAVVNYGAYVLVLHSVSGRWAPMLGVAAGSGAGMVVNFFAARYLIFKARREP